LKFALSALGRQSCQGILRQILKPGGLGQNIHTALERHDAILPHVRRDWQSAALFTGKTIIVMKVTESGAPNH
jgi:hypothetical protein